MRAGETVLNVAAALRQEEKALLEAEQGRAREAEARRKAEDALEASRKEIERLRALLPAESA